MRPRFVHVGFSFGEKAVSIKKIEATFDKADDWFRYDENCWLLFTSLELNIWRDRLRKAMGPGVTFLLVEIAAYSGYLEQSAWDWMREHGGERGSV